MPNETPKLNCRSVTSGNLENAFELGPAEYPRWKSLSSDFGDYGFFYFNRINLDRRTKARSASFETKGFGDRCFRPCFVAAGTATAMAN